MKLEVGLYRDRTKRYEVRHLNDCKLAHPASMAAPASRPKLGRPPTSTSGSKLTPIPPQNHSPALPDPPSDSTGRDSGNKQSGNFGGKTHATSNPEERVPSPTNQSGEGETQSSILPQTVTGAPPVAAFPTRAARTTRNQNPRYIDAIWSASPIELAYINQSING